MNDEHVEQEGYWTPEKYVAMDHAYSDAVLNSPEGAMYRLNHGRMFDRINAELERRAAARLQQARAAAAAEKARQEREKREEIALEAAQIKAQVDMIIGEEAARAGLKPVRVYARSRRLDIIRARQIAMWRMREETILSAAAIGRVFHMDHTTVLHAWRKIDKMLDGMKAAGKPLPEWAMQ